MSDDKISFKKASQELQQILDRLEGDQVDVDELAPQIQRAAELIRLCHERLRKAEMEVQKALKGLEKVAAEAEKEEENEEEPDLLPP